MIWLLNHWKTLEGQIFIDFIIEHRIDVEESLVLHGSFILMDRHRAVELLLHQQSNQMKLSCLAWKYCDPWRGETCWSLSWFFIGGPTSRWCIILLRSSCRTRRDVQLCSWLHFHIKSWRAYKFYFKINDFKILFFLNFSKPQIEKWHKPKL
jgi:hypothetical protein